MCLPRTIIDRFSFFLERTGLIHTKSKEEHELRYWLSRKAAEGSLTNDHYTYFYTEHFGLSPEYYSGKRILDIGCGPRGSLEWADMAAERIGLDPLADEYLKLGAANHKMSYVASGSETIPFPDEHFDVVCSFNSLDHVNDLNRTIAEIIRVVRPGGLFLLLTDVNHRPTPTEPIEFSWDIKDYFQPALEAIEERHYEKRGGMYESIREGRIYDHDNPARRYGITSLKFRKPVANENM